MVNQTEVTMRYLTAEEQAAEDIAKAKEEFARRVALDKLKERQYKRGY